jgi:hypothetical protein
MKFINESKEDTWEFIKGSCGQGTLGCSYDILVKVFGLPYLIPEEDQDKSKVEWVIVWEDGTISTIYDWKWFGRSLEEIEIWNIGGFDYKSALYVQEFIYEDI